MRHGPARGPAARTGAGVRFAHPSLFAVLRPPPRSGGGPGWGQPGRDWLDFPSCSGPHPNPSPGGERAQGRIGWGEQSEPQRSPCGKGRLESLRQGPVLGFALLTPAYSLFCALLREAGEGRGGGNPGAIGWIFVVLRPPAQPFPRRGKGSSRIGWGEQSEPQRPPCGKDRCWGSLRSPQPIRCSAPSSAKRRRAGVGVAPGAIGLDFRRAPAPIPTLPPAGKGLKPHRLG